MSDYLPNDVLVDVLSRLPVKTLVRFVCVCKSWNSLITNPTFITTQLNRSSLANNNHLLLQRHTDYGTLRHYSLLRCENHTFCDYVALEFPLEVKISPGFSTICSCNGIVCVSYDLEDGLCLWNPSIHKMMTLPPATFQPHDSYWYNIGFGFDSLTDDYKVVRIVYLLPNFDQNPPEVEIFSLRTGTWRNISHLDLPYTICKKASQAYVNGAAHWLAWDLRRTRSSSNPFVLILSFHMGDEVFGEIMLPNGMPTDDFMELNVRVAKFQESLSLINDGIRDKHTCCIWVMKEHGISQSWTKQFNIDMTGRFLNFDMTGGLFNVDVSRKYFDCVAGFTKKGEVLFWTSSFGCLVAYDPKENRELFSPKIRGCTESWSDDSFYVDAYTESLVLFGAKFRDTITSMVSPVLHGEASEAEKSRKRREKPKKKGKKRQDA